MIAFLPLFLVLAFWIGMYVHTQNDKIKRLEKKVSRMFKALGDELGLEIHDYSYLEETNIYQSRERMTVSFEAQQIRKEFPILFKNFYLLMRHLGLKVEKKPESEEIIKIK